MQEQQLLLRKPQEAFAEKMALAGPPLAVFSFRGRWWSIVLNFLLASGLGWLFYLFLGGKLFSAVMRFLTDFLGLRRIIRQYQQRGWQVLVFPEGVAQIQLDETDVFLWDNVETLEKRSGGPEHLFFCLLKGYILAYVVRRTDGKEFTFDDCLPGFPELIDIIERETLKVLFPRALKALGAGEAMFFGRLQVDLEGLTVGEETLHWEDITDITVDQIRVSVMRKGRWLPWFETTTSSFPNAHVFRALTDHLLEVTRAVGGAE